MRECPPDSEASSDAEAPDASSCDSLDISSELQAEIRAFAAGLPDMDCYQVLGIQRDADVDAIRAAFFERSRRFHPDRYFNKRLGSYAALLHEIYKRVVAANEVLRDPQLRKRYDSTLGRENTLRARMDPSRRPIGLPGKAKARPSSGSSLRARKGLRAPLAGLDGLAAQLAQSRFKGKDRFTEARAAAERGEWSEAVRKARLALAFDPRDLEYQDGLAEWLGKCNAERARDARRRAETALALGDKSEALEALTLAAELSPTDAEVSRRAADLALELEDLQRAVQFAEAAVALDESDSRTRKQLGLLYLRVGRREEARRTLQRVWEANPMDKEVKAALQGL